MVKQKSKKIIEWEHTQALIDVSRRMISVGMFNEAKRCAASAFLCAWEEQQKHEAKALMVEANVKGVDAGLKNKPVRYLSRPGELVEKDPTAEELRGFVRSLAERTVQVPSQLRILQKLCRRLDLDELYDNIGERIKSLEPPTESGDYQAIPVPPLLGYLPYGNLHGMRRDTHKKLEPALPQPTRDR